MKSSVSERLTAFIKAQGLSVRQFEKQIGTSQGYVKSVTGGISADKLHRICGLYPTLNADWLLTGNGSMLRDVPSINQTNVLVSNSANGGTVVAEVSELQAQLREKDLEIAHLHDRLMRAEEWNSRLFELLKNTQK